jgi:hypothetical protein
MVSVMGRNILSRFGAIRAPRRKGSVRMGFWAARDEYGDLFLFIEKPVRREDEGIWGLEDEETGIDFTVDRELLPNLQWDDEPIFVQITGLKEV